MRHLPSRARRRLADAALLALAATLVVVVPRPAVAQTAAALYDKARSAEQALSDAAPADALRRVAAAYRAVVLQHPTSGRCDDALWQAAGLLERAWMRWNSTRDRDEAVKVLEWLAREYPTSPLARRAPPRAAALKASPVPVPVAAATPPPAAARGQTAAAPLAAAPVLRSLSLTALPRGERISLELSAEVAYTGERVANPDRVFFDFPNATAAAALADQARALHSPLVKGVRVGTPARGVTRVVIELIGAPRHSAFALYGPFRVVVDLEAAAPPDTPQPSVPPALPPTTTPPPATPAVTPRATPAAAAPAATPSPTPSPAPLVPDASPVAPSSTKRGDYSLARQLGLRVAKVVIDPGHGGHDPGAMSNGITEADLVLDVALRLEKLLEAVPGVEVVLTRRTNEFVPLEERTAIANREHADLFLSIHANSHRHPAVRGIETYFLNFATNPDAEAVAARENAASVQTMGTLPAIVKAIALNNKLEESREFAALLQASLVRRLRTTSGGGKDLGVKQAPFVVLIGAQMPSVLAEIAFITNKAEAGLFKQPAQRQLTAQALRDAIVRYQDSLKRVSTSGSQAR